MDFALPEHEDDELSPLDGEEHHIKFNMVGFDDSKSDDDTAPVCKQASTSSCHLTVPEARRRFESAPATMGIGASPMLRAALDMVAADHALEQFQLDDPHSDEDRDLGKQALHAGCYYKHGDCESLFARSYRMEKLLEADCRSKLLGPGASPVLLSALDGVAASADTSALSAQR
ncbi:unnamed protein product, partial [Symbiodinium pilosum]